MNQIQKEYSKQLKRISRLNVEKQVKIEMLESLKQIIKQHCKIQSLIFNQSFNQISMVKDINRPTQVQSTKFSESLSIDNITMISCRDIEQLEEQILRKKMTKIEKYEEIQSYEEELYQMEDIVQYKRKYNDHLRKSIDQKMIAIEEEKQSSRRAQKTTRSVSADKCRNPNNKSFSDYLKSWWN